jgi:MYXO-CTERM domain-containing protein
MEPTVPTRPDPPPPPNSQSVPEPGHRGATALYALALLGLAAAAIVVEGSGSLPGMLVVVVLGALLFWRIHRRPAVELDVLGIFVKVAAVAYVLFVIWVIWAMRNFTF